MFAGRITGSQASAKHLTAGASTLAECRHEKDTLPRKSPRLQSPPIVVNHAGVPPQSCQKSVHTSAESAQTFCDSELEKPCDMRDNNDVKSHFSIPECSTDGKVQGSDENVGQGNRCISLLSLDSTDGEENAAPKRSTADRKKKKKSGKFYDNNEDIQMKDGQKTRKSPWSSREMLSRGEKKLKRSEMNLKNDLKVVEDQRHTTVDNHTEASMTKERLTSHKLTSHENHGGEGSLSGIPWCFRVKQAWVIDKHPRLRVNQVPRTSIAPPKYVPCSPVEQLKNLEKNRVISMPNVEDIQIKSNTRGHPHKPDSAQNLEKLAVLPKVPDLKTPTDMVKFQLQNQSEFANLRNQLRCEKLKAELAAWKKHQVEDQHLSKDELEKKKLKKRKEKRLKHMEKERQLVKLNHAIKASLALKKPNVEKCEGLLEDLKSLSLSPLMMLKYPDIVVTISKVVHWGLDGDLAERATRVMDKFQVMFALPEDETFFNVFQEKVKRHHESVYELNGQEKMESNLKWQLEDFADYGINSNECPGFSIPLDKNGEEKVQEGFASRIKDGEAAESQCKSDVSNVKAKGGQCFDEEQTSEIQTPTEKILVCALAENSSESKREGTNSYSGDAVVPQASHMDAYDDSLDRMLDENDELLNAVSSQEKMCSSFSNQLFSDPEHSPLTGQSLGDVNESREHNITEIKSLSPQISHNHEQNGKRSKNKRKLNSELVSEFTESGEELNSSQASTASTTSSGRSPRTLMASVYNTFSRLFIATRKRCKKTKDSEY